MKTEISGAVESSRRATFQHVVAPLAIPVSLVFLIKHIADRELILSLLAGYMTILLTWAALSAQIKVFKAVPVDLIGVSAGAIICASIYIQGPVHTFWTFPAIVMGYFGMQRTFVRICSAAMLIAVPALALHVWDWNWIAFLFASLLTTVVGIDILTSRLDMFHQELLNISTKDPLTNCFNRRSIPELEETITGDDAYLLLIDLDNFKTVNDTYGHDAGDNVLKKVVQTIQAEIRDTDCIIRMGGDEFAVLLAYATHEQAKKVAERLRDAIATSSHEQMHSVTLSVGISPIDPSAPLASALSNADQMLYKAKEVRNHVVG